MKDIRPKIKWDGPRLHSNVAARLAKPVTGVICLSCGSVLVSYTRHDYKTCGCSNAAMIDGGSDYTRYGAMSMDKIKLVNVSLVEDKTDDQDDAA